ncbi:MAG TPA: hypothetical protein VFH39_03680 [Candidatus Saccharimonadales bacterium]|nr:hypothetical protein [Candidatus Saccharimonadales bacterium]
MAKKQKHTRRAKRKNVWFIKVRGSYLPSSWQGWLTYIPFTAYLLWSLSVGWQGTHTLGMALLFIVPNWIAAAAVTTWVAKHTS